MDPRAWGLAPHSGRDVAPLAQGPRGTPPPPGQAGPPAGRAPQPGQAPQPGRPLLHRAVGAPPTSPPPAPARPDEAEESQQDRQQPRVLLPDGWARAVRATFGLLSPGSVAAAERERVLLARVRAPLGHPRRVAVLGAKGGVGTTTVTALLGGVLGGLRHNRAVALDLSGPRGDLHGRLGASNPPDLSSPAVLNAEVVPTGAGHLPLEVLCAPPVRRALPPPETIQRLLTRLDAEHGFSLLDLGDQPETAHAAMALSVADTVVLVASRTPDSVSAAREMLWFVEATAGPAVIERCLVVQTALAPAPRAEPPTLTPMGSLPLRFARTLAEGGPIRPGGLASGFREELLAVAGTVASQPPR